MTIRFFRSEELPRDVISHDFVGEREGGIEACILFVNAAPGEGPRLHRHPYVEILIVIEGTSTFDDGATKRLVEAGEMVVVDAQQPHAFVNSGSGPLRQIDIHLSPRFSTEWLA